MNKLISKSILKQNNQTSKELRHQKYIASTFLIKPQNKLYLFETFIEIKIKLNTS